MKTFVLGDIHGASRALDQCMERSGFDFENDRLIQLGDVVDGFSDVYDCVETLLRVKHLVALKGNHDDWFLEFIRTGYHPTGWNYSGKETALSYLKLTGRERFIKRGRDGYKTALDAKDIPRSHREFFKSQLLYHIDDENNCYVHAGFNRFLSFTMQKPETFYWDRELWLAALDYQTMKDQNPAIGPFINFCECNEIYIGHTPTVNWGTDKPMHAVNIFNMDTGARQGGRLTIMDIRTKEYWQSDVVEELYGVMAGF
ncbi:MAG TPA: metallophosphoesterase [Puia sp.]|nr:metallophosphoesterase [Puia sp.]